jgi:nucleoside-diphosphate-sugar epimerase
LAPLPKSKKAVGWKSERSFFDSLEDTLKWWRQNI